MYKRLTDEEQRLAREVVDIAFNIHKSLGPGLLESVYAKCFCYELKKRDIKYEAEKVVALHYQSIKIDGGLRIDLLIENQLIIELKAQESFHPVWEAQLLSYLKLTGIRLGFIINFHVPLIKDGIQRIVL